jgi:hypothetical protein
MLHTVTQNKLHTVTQNKLHTVTQSKLHTVTQNKLRTVTQNKVRTVTQNKLRIVTQNKLRADTEQVTYCDTEQVTYCDTEQVTYWRPTDIKRHGTEFSLPVLGISDVTVLKNVKVIVDLQIWGNEGGEYEGDRLLGNVFQMYDVTSQKPEICIMLNAFLNLAWDVACRITVKL